MRRRRGLVLLQIDGLAHDTLLAALRQGYAPFLRHLLTSGAFRLHRYRCGLPTNTPAVQAAILYPEPAPIPGFRWFEKEAGLHLSFRNPRAARLVEARCRARGPGLLVGGSSYANLLSGDAARSWFTVSTLFSHDLPQVRDPGALLRHLWGHPVTALRLALRVAGGLAPAIVDALRRPDTRGQGEGGRWPCPGVGAPLLDDDVVSELITASACADLACGVPSVYVTFFGYDEASHRWGPESSRALIRLRRIDRWVRRLAETARRATARAYELYVLSDHGQAPSIPLVNLCGQTLGEIVRALTGGRSVAEFGSGLGHVSSPGGSLGEWLEELPRPLPRSAAWAVRAWGRLLCRWATQLRPEPLTVPDEVVVCDSGSLAHVYLAASTGRVTLTALDRRYPGLIERLAEQEGIGLVLAHLDGGFVLHARQGTAVYGTLPRVRGKHPLEQFDDPAVALEQLSALARMPESGDLILLGACREGRVANFEAQWSAHGGLGGQQDAPFVLCPARVPLELSPGDGPGALHRFLRARYLEDEGLAGQAGPPTTGPEAHRSFWEAGARTP